MTEDRHGLGSARAIAEDIRRRIREECQLTASAGVSYCKFIAKLASDHRKPDGLCVITPERGPEFVASLPVARFHGVGPVTAKKMERLGILTGADLRDWSMPALQAHFGSSADWYWRICRGIDEREVKPDRPYKSVSAERTFDEDLRDPDRLAAELDAHCRLCLGPRQARRGDRPNRDAQGQVRRLHDHHPVEELRRSRSRPRRVHRCRSGASRHSPPLIERYQAARVWASTT